MMQTQSARRQTGYMLLESLIAILVFGIGVLGIVSLYAASVKNAGGAKYRSDASFLANQLIGRMWVADRRAANLKANFQGGPQSPGVADGAQYTAWAAEVQGMLPGVTNAVNQPSVSITSINVSIPFNPARAKSLATVTVRWQVPGEASAHNFVAVAEINQ